MTTLKQNNHSRLYEAGGHVLEWHWLCWCDVGELTSFTDGVPHAVRVARLDTDAESHTH